MTEELGEYNAGEGTVSIPNDIARFDRCGVLDTLLADRTTGGSIIWATVQYERLGSGFGARDEMTPGAVAGENLGLIRRRAQKDKDEKSALTKAHAEVFTPAWIVKLMVDAADKAWGEGQRKKGLSDGWRSYVSSNRLEITCGEAPYLVNRYDAADGSVTPMVERTGILSRKLALVNENTKTRNTWMKWAKTALKSTYGYEFQGDNLLIARINVLCTMEDYLRESGFEGFTAAEYEELANIVSWNLWQMDGLTKCVPFGKSVEDAPMPTLFDAFEEPKEEAYSDCVIYDWEKGESVKFSSIRRGSDMKFDYIIGNPPYQEETEGNGRENPIYNHFMEGAYEAGKVVELITPARFLFNAGQTPKAWNKKMLEDPHLKVLFYESDSAKVFPPPTDIKGGVAITLRDDAKEFEPIGIFTAYPELNGILAKTIADERYSLSDIVIGGVPYSYTEQFRMDHPSSVGLAGKSYDVRTNALDKLSGIIYFDQPQDNSEDWAQMFGLFEGKRTYKWVEGKYLNVPDNFRSYKVLVPKSNGSGAFGEPLSSPLIGFPLVGHTQTFISIGNFDTQEEAIACLKYLKGKFARALLGVLKTTQDNSKNTWKYIPLQDFTADSDIDWSKPISGRGGVDSQLYAKYGLSPEEIEFIETHVKEMD